MGPRHAFLNLFIPVESDRPLSIFYVGPVRRTLKRGSSDAPHPWLGQAKPDPRLIFSGSEIYNPLALAEPVARLIQI